jgi:hypothetical protein
MNHTGYLLLNLDTSLSHTCHGINVSRPSQKEPPGLKKHQTYFSSFRNSNTFGVYSSFSVLLHLATKGYTLTIGVAYHPTCRFRHIPMNASMTGQDSIQSFYVQTMYGKAKICAVYPKNLHFRLRDALRGINNQCNYEPLCD